MRARYVVLSCFPGCLPEGEPAEFTNRREANAYALELARDIRDGREGSKIVGREGNYQVVFDAHYGTGICVETSEV